MYYKRRFRDATYGKPIEYSVEQVRRLMDRLENLTEDIGDRSMTDYQLDGIKVCAMDIISEMEKIVKTANNIEKDRKVSVIKPAFDSVRKRR